MDGHGGTVDTTVAAAMTGTVGTATTSTTGTGAMGTTATATTGLVVIVGTTVTGTASDERLAAAFGKQVARWSQEQGASAAAIDIVRRAAAWVSQATSNGHSCMAVDELAVALNLQDRNGAPLGMAASGASSAARREALDVQTLRRHLLESRVVGTPEAPNSLPLILDEERLYLHRYFDYECRLAAGLEARSRDRAAAGDMRNTGGGGDAGHPRAGDDGDGAFDAGSTFETGSARQLPPRVGALLDRLFIADATDGTDASRATRASATSATSATSVATNAGNAGNATQPIDALDATGPNGSSNARKLPDWQKIAVITALLGRLTLISGGPGTGKTTTVVNLLACLIESDPECRIALAAPTGKAAARMIEVIQQRAQHLPSALRERLPKTSTTIHRLLGSRPHGEFRYHAAQPLPIDVLIVDEASMLDLALAVHLIEAVPPNARIILLGDKDQLAAVESGAVFSELSARPAFSAERIQTLSRLCRVEPGAFNVSPADAPSAPSPGNRTGLDDCVVWLRRNYRFDANSAIGLLASETNEGNAAGVVNRLKEPPDASLTWINETGSMLSTRAVQALLDAYAPYVEALRRHAGAASADGTDGTDGTDGKPTGVGASGANGTNSARRENGASSADDAADAGSGVGEIDVGYATSTASAINAVSTAFARMRVLCAVRDGPWGVNALNEQISRHCRVALRHPLDAGFQSAWYPGRPVMVLRNDSILKLFNGDIGIALPDAEGIMQVWFPAEAGGFRAIAPVRLPEHETAFAMTVHKSQGSEFDAVLLVLPADQNRVLTRELLYTAVTRARQRLCIIGSAAIVASTVDTATRRVSGLLARGTRGVR